MRFFWKIREFFFMRRKNIQGVKNRKSQTQRKPHHPQTKAEILNLQWVSRFSLNVFFILFLPLSALLRGFGYYFILVSSQNILNNGLTLTIKPHKISIDLFISHFQEPNILRDKAPSCTAMPSIPKYSPSCTAMHSIPKYSKWNNIEI